MEKADQLQRIQKRILARKNLPLANTATNLVFGKGNVNAPIFFIGEAPGAKEDEQGIPFVGSAGKRLDALLHSIGLTLEDVYIANILKYRPPNNRPPNPEEIKCHTPFLVEQIQVIKPKVIVTLGNFATRFVACGLNTEKMADVPGITQLHGKPLRIKFDAMDFTVIPLFHPAAVIYNPRLKPILDEDFKVISGFLKSSRT